MGDIMKIVIFSPTSTKLIDNKLDSRPLAGADQALIRTINSLSCWHEVVAYVPINKVVEDDNITMKPFQDLFNEKVECDVLIHYRKCYAIPNTIKYKKAVFYSQDDIDSPCFKGIPQDYMKLYDRLIVLSEYHKKRLLDYFEYDENKVWICGNGAEDRTPKEKEGLNFIYASTPFRGLVVLAKMWKEIIKLFPEAKLHVFSSMKIYDGDLHDQIYFNTLYEKLKNIKGIIYHGTKPQKEVLKCMDKCKLLLYPNTFPETYCNVLMEARASETPFITSDKGSLKETGEKAGIYIKGDPYSKEYQDEFIDQFKILMKFDSTYKMLQDNCYPIRSWINHRLEFESMMLFLKEMIENEKDKSR